MGPLAMTGLAGFGATIAIGLLASAAPILQTSTSQRVRTFAIIQLAFAESVGVLGAVVGLLAAAYGVTHDTSVAPVVLAAGLPIAGAVIGLARIIWGWPTSDHGISLFGAIFILGLATLGVVVAILSRLIVESAPRSVVDWPFFICGSASALAALTIGVTGASALRATRDADPGTVSALVASQVRRLSSIQLVVVASTVVALLLMTVGASR